MLDDARKILEEFVSSLDIKPLAHKLSEGLDMLDEAILSSADDDTIKVAKNIAHTYIHKVYDFVTSSLESKSISELELERLNDVLIEIRESAFGVKEEVEPIRNKVIAGLIKHYFKGYTAKEQKDIIDNITSIDT